MRYIPVFPAVLFCPVSAMAAETAGEAGGFSLFASLVQMVASLAVVIGVILVFHHLSKRWMRGSIPGSSQPKYIRVVESRFLAPKKALMLVEVAGEYILVSSCGDTINFIKQIDMIEEVEVVGELPCANFREAFQDRLKEFAARLPLGAGAFAASMKKGGAGS